MAASYSYSVILEPQEGGGFTVLVPALPEVVTEGETEQEALANVEEEIRPRISAGTGVDASVRCPSRNSSRNGGCLSMGGGRLPVVNGKRVITKSWFRRHTASEAEESRRPPLRFPVASIPREAVPASLRTS